MTQRDHKKEKRITFESGAQASNIEERYDLICPAGLRRLAARYALGAAKYGDLNWCLGVPISVRLNHLIRHLQDYLANGNANDDNMAAIAWNAFAIMHYEDNCKHHEVFPLPFKAESTATWICSFCKNPSNLREFAYLLGDGRVVCEKCKVALITGGESID